MVVASKTPVATTESVVAPTHTRFVITPFPPPKDPFEAATRAVAATVRARSGATATLLPPNMIVATNTPKPFIVTPTPIPANSATAEYRAALATALAFTTGTPTPPPGGFIVATVTPAPTPTAAVIALEDLPSPTPTPGFPVELVGKILFLSNRRGRVEVYAVNPDGSGAALVTSRWPYDFAVARDAYSADRAGHAFAQPETPGNKQLQIFRGDNQSNGTRPMTAFDAGSVSAPAWSPTADVVTFVSNADGSDEIWLVQKDKLPAQQLTRNAWEVNHHPSWSPDGSRIVFSSNRGGQNELWLMNADGSEQQPLPGLEFEAWDPVWVKYAD